ncbi:NAD(P)-binding protein [Hypoxylon sp. FL1284]|nr:NAD(P)-binding protein [Hypoxylon sp. FL1284]
MVKLDIIQSANAALADAAKTFTAVVAGGTAGIGEATVRAIAAAFAHRGSGVRVHIVGRNKDAASKIIADCEIVCPGGSFRFHKGDLSLLRDVDNVCNDITRVEREEAEKIGTPAKIDFLVCCQGILSTKFEDTVEGLDKYVSLFYYSRMRFIDRLLPLLTASPLAGHVVSVLNAGVQSAPILDDLTLHNPRNQNIQSAFPHLVGMTNAFMERIALENPGKIALSHYYPGLVPTGSGSSGNFPWWLKFLVVWVVDPLLRPFGVPLEKCGQHVLFMASPTRFPARRAHGGAPGNNTRVAIKYIDGLEAAKGMDEAVGSGAYRVQKDGKIFPHDKGYSKLQENGEEIYQHTMSVFKEIQAGRAFKA